jgi:hypothetical protein
MTPLAKIILVVGPLLSALFVALKLSGPLARWSWWWAPVPTALVLLVAFGFVVWLNMAADYP